MKKVVELVSMVAGVLMVGSIVLIPFLTLAVLVLLVVKLL